MDKLSLPKDKMMLRLLLSLIICIAGTLYGFWWWNNQTPIAQNWIDSHLPRSSYYTMETRFSAQNIMDTNSALLTKGGHKRFLSPSVHYLPYLLMDVKYTKNDSTGEGVLLWGLDDGEMVINTSTWEITHGFKDCIQASLSREEFKLINAIAKHNNRCDRATLLSLLRMEEEEVDALIASCRRKKIIVQANNDYRLHFETPKINVIPETIMEQPLAIHAKMDTANLIAKSYTPAQVKAMAQAAFGGEFAIRSEKEVFLPVHRLVVENGDGSTSISYWNAINGKQIHTFSLS